MNVTAVNAPVVVPGPRLTVAYVVYRFHTGGLERCVAHFVNHLDRDRFQPLIISLTENGDAMDWLTVSDVEIVALQKRIGNDPGVVRRLANTLREHAVDVVHSHNWGTLVETVLARRWAKVPGHLHAEHGQELQAMHERGVKKRLRNIARRWALSQADTVVVCAESVRDRVAGQCGFSPQKMQFIPNGVDRPLSSAGVPQRETIRRGLGLTENDILIGSLSRLVPVKDFPTAMEAISIAAAQDERLHLVIVGDGPEEAKLRQFAGSSPASRRIHFVGRQENIADWLAAFDIFVNSSLSEAMNMAILEAMSVGLPIIATDVGDNASLLDGDECGGLVVPSADPRSLAAAMTRLCSDAALREQTSRLARDRYESHYTREMMVQAYSAAYEQIVPLLQTSAAEPA